MMMHHMPKPSTDPKSKSGWNATDHSYAGTGSSELTNWARAVCVLQSTMDEGKFVLRLAKRANRASATDVDGGLTNLIHLKHAEGSILWEQTAAPIVAEPKPTKEELSSIRCKATSKELKYVDGLIERINEPMNKKEIQALAEEQGHGFAYLVEKHWAEIESRLVKTNGRRFEKPNK